MIIVFNKQMISLAPEHETIRFLARMHHWCKP